MSQIFVSLATAVKLDPAIYLPVLFFVLKVFVFAIPFLLLGFFLEKVVDGRERIPRSRRLVKLTVLLAAAFPLFALGFLNYFNSIRPIMLAGFLEKNPDLENLFVIEGVFPALLLVGITTIFTILHAVEILNGETRG